MSNRSSMRLRCHFAAAILFSVLAGSAGTAFAQTPISGASPNPDGGDPTDPFAVTACNGAPQTGLVYRNSETEPYIAVNPTNSENMIAGWHQDRWSTGGGQSLGTAVTLDGGLSWHQVILPFTRCSGGTGNAGDFERASDPWISFSTDGTAHYMSLSFKDSVSENAMVTARSADGGLTWSAPVIIARSPAQDGVLRSLFHDKNSITADPHNPDIVYATWTLFRTGNTSLLVARSTDGGRRWGPAIPIATYEGGDPREIVFFRQGAQIVVDPNTGTLYNAFYRIILNQNSGQVRLDHALFRSDDQGKHWTRRDLPVAQFNSTNAVDPDFGIPVRDAGEIPDIAIAPSGKLYLSWQDMNPITKLVTSLVSMSDDGGDTWSTPVPVSHNAANVNVQTFLPMVSVNNEGLVGVLFYDFRNDALGDATLDTDVWLSLFTEDLGFVAERRLTTQSMDFRQSVITGARGYFPGDYVGLDTAGPDFVAAFTQNNDLGLPVAFPQPAPTGPSVDVNNRTDIVFARVTP